MKKVGIITGIIAGIAAIVAGVFVVRKAMSEDLTLDI